MALKTYGVVLNKSKEAKLEKLVADLTRQVADLEAQLKLIRKPLLDFQEWYLEKYVKEKIEEPVLD